MQKKFLVNWGFGSNNVMEILSKQHIQELEKIASRVRARVLLAVHNAGGGHVGGPLSCTDMLVALYFQIMNINPQKPDWKDRDRFILSKGHSTIALYSVLAERGYFPIEELNTFDAIDSRLQGHPDMTMTPGIDMSSGSLGQGLSPGIGMALGARKLKKDFHTYVMLGDGEVQEGQIWEAAFVASRYGLDNLTAILDNNRLQQYGWQMGGTVMQPPFEQPDQKWQAFGWNTIEIDGHNIEEFINAIKEAKKIPGIPTIIIAHTTKGKGVSFMEDQYDWHARIPDDKELILALRELGQSELSPLSSGG
jgi:transketolase